MQESHKHFVPWKKYIILTVESLLAFYLATFSFALFFKHHGPNWIPLAVLLGFLYLFVIFACAKRLFQQLPIATIMLIIPIAPFIALSTVISLIPVLQHL